MWTETSPETTPWLNPGTYPFQSATQYDALLEYDFAFMTYDGEIISDPGWGLANTSTSWMDLANASSSWSESTPESTPWL